MASMPNDVYCIVVASNETSSVWNPVIEVLKDKYGTTFDIRVIVLNGPQPATASPDVFGKTNFHP